MILLQVKIPASVNGIEMEDFELTVVAKVQLHRTIVIARQKVICDYTWSLKGKTAAYIPAIMQFRSCSASLLVLGGRRVDPPHCRPPATSIGTPPY
jgi:hypothetical protein